jgi:hypothetical protein
VVAASVVGPAVLVEVEGSLVASVSVLPVPGSWQANSAKQVVESKEAMRVIAPI